MKNIHILPTDKPSRLVKIKDNLFYTTTENIPGGVYQHIYITSDEEIKEGEYNVPSDFSSFLDISKTSKEDLQIVNEKSNGYRKIILTTDQSLDGVQAIDDEFLEWFVKNPSCEEVEVKDVFKSSPIGFGNAFDYYKIIIPKEETLEEFIQREGYPEGHTQDIWEDGVRRGINWQQEQILQFLYSEIIERRPYSSSKMCEKVIEFIEQFKKK